MAFGFSSKGVPPALNKSGIYMCNIEKVKPSDKGYNITLKPIGFRTALNWHVCTNAEKAKESAVNRGVEDLLYLCQQTGVEEFTDIETAFEPEIVTDAAGVKTTKYKTLEAKVIFGEGFPDVMQPSQSPSTEKKSASASPDVTAIF